MYLLYIILNIKKRKKKPWSSNWRRHSKEKFRFKSWSGQNN